MDALNSILKLLKEYDYMDQGRGTGNPHQTMSQIKKIAEKGLTLDELTPIEEEAIKRTMAEMEFYDKYKDFMREVKTIFLNNGPEVAKKYIRDSADHLLSIACDELFWSLFTKL